MNGAFTYRGMQVIENDFLPFDATAPACDIETREEVEVLTGEKIHAVQHAGVLLVSSEMFKKIVDCYEYRVCK